MKTKIVLALLASALAGCAAGPQSAAKISYYDLAPLAAAPNNRIVAALGGVEVVSPSWLDSPALQYRLAYQGDRARQKYAESRLVAPPAELVGHALRRRMLPGESAGACKLRIDLDEFVQVFDTADASRAVVEARVQLLAARGGELLARRSFSLSRPAAKADAKGGVAALAAAVEDLAAALHDWLGSLDQEAKQGFNVAERCRGA